MTMGMLNNVLKKAAKGISRIGAHVEVVDNLANPASAASMIRRKTASKGKPPGFLVGDRVVPYRNYQQQARDKKD